MIAEKEAGLIDVDYAESTSTTGVFTQATWAAISGQRNLRALGFVQGQQSRPLDMPSWVIDFASKTIRELGNPNPEEYEGRAWCKTSPRIEALVSRNSHTLMATGLVLDTIKDVVPLTGSVDAEQYGSNPIKKPRKPIDLIMSTQKREFTLDKAAVSKIVASLQQLPSHDPYCLLHAGDHCIAGCTTDVDWQALRDCAEQHMYRPTENAIVSSRQTCLFSVWARCLSLHLRTSSTLTKEREVLLRLNREQKAKRFSFFTTTHGFLGVGPRSAQRGDKIVLLYGSRLPAVLHEHNRGDCTFVGLCLVNGVSYGELCDVVPDLRLEEHTFCLI